MIVLFRHAVETLNALESLSEHKQNAQAHRLNKLQSKWDTLQVERDNLSDRCVLWLCAVTARRDLCAVTARCALGHHIAHQYGRPMTPTALGRGL